MSKSRSEKSEPPTVGSLRARLLATLQYLQSLEDFPSAADFREATEKFAAENDVRSLRFLCREIDLLANEVLTRNQREALDAILKQQAGADRSAERVALSQRVAAAVKRGRIVSEVERQHIENYAELLEAEGGSDAELDAIWKLLAT